METVILKVLVGSRAHGLAGPESDADYRGVYVLPTTEMFRLGFKPAGPRWREGGPDGDETLWEVGPFLELAVQCHPLILEALLAPVVTADRWGEELRDLFPSVWAPRRAYDAFVGYAYNQRKKMLDRKDGRPAKYASAYLRVLYNLCELLETGRFTVRTVDTPLGPTLADLRDGRYRPGAVIDQGEHWLEEAARRLAACSHEPDLGRVDDYLIRLRKAFLA